MKKLLEIFTMFFKIGMFTIGGGYAMLPIIQKEVVDKKSWMNEEEFLDAISLTNSLPGPLATNAATFIGYRVSKVKGAVTAVIGAVLPSIIIILLIASFFKNAADYPIVQNIFNAIRPAVVALILYSVIKLAGTAKITKNLNWLVALIAFSAITFFNIHPIIVIICAALYGLVLYDYVYKALNAKDIDKRKE
ncbi:MAG: chromate transporter [Clostridiales bacterium]|nr:chromate transporter [Bacillota bacterium]MEE0516475.1 chromate transporter [Anaerovoracaceae bacterium]PWL93387.1 MAG: chromate transporter [Clostridiales bacterium]